MVKCPLAPKFWPHGQWCFVGVRGQISELQGCRAKIAGQRALALVSIVFHRMEVPTNLSSDQKVNFQFYDSFSGCSAPLYGLLVCLKSGHKMTKAFMLLATRQNTAAGKTRTRDQRRLLFGEWNFFSTKKALPAKNFRCSSTRSLGFTHNLHLPSQGSVSLKK